MTNKIPRHVAIIMDGNGRWAEAKGLVRSIGHRAGLESAKKLVPYVFKKGVEVLTVFAFSTENWQRSKEEVACLFDLFREAMEEALPDIIRRNIRVRFIGDREGLRVNFAPLVLMMQQIEEESAQNTGGTFVVAINYGGRNEITRAVKKIMLIGVHPAVLRESTLSAHLDTHGLPDVDLIIRTAGEQRISNFLLFQSAYAEFYYSRKLWPAFGKRDFEQALREYSRRKRNFGAIKQG